MRPAHLHFCGSLGSGPTGELRAFTLLELLVSVSIIALLIAILSSTVSRVRESGRDLVCKTKKKTVASEFFLFADDYAHPWRGDSEKYKSKFRLDDFVERMYALDEFWQNKSHPGAAYDASEHALLCPSSRKELRRSPNGKDLPCGKSSFDNWANVSTAFNLRLLKKVYFPRPTIAIPQPAYVDRQTMRKGMVPLAFDVDGAAAVAALPSDDEHGSLYGTPLLAGENYNFYTNRWHPALRHLNRMNVAFVGGHVLSSSDPEREANWMWRYWPK